MDGNPADNIARADMAAAIIRDLITRTEQAWDEICEASNREADDAMERALRTMEDAVRAIDAERDGIVRTLLEDDASKREILGKS